MHGFGHGASTQSTSGELTKGNWHHVAYRYAPNELTFFINGKQVASNKGGQQKPQPPQFIHIGGYFVNQIVEEPFNGAIDEVRIYNRALSEAEVKALYEIEKPKGKDSTPPKKPGTLLWEFETGGIVLSSPAIGSDGTVYVGSTDKKLYAIKTNSKGLAKSPWPMRGQNARHTGRMMK